tara:strand:+ start:36 stop:212 length:177 start_codon:yes stop_codon:yes gene_type:complete
MSDVRDMPKKVRNTKRLIPEIKTKVIQDERISSVCPISGCIINRNDAGTIAMKLRKYL